MRLIRIALSLLFLCTVAHAQTPAQIEEAKAEFVKGQTAYDLTQYDVALVHYTKAFELSKFPAILFNLAQANRKLYEKSSDMAVLRQARELYKSYLRQVPFSSDRSVAEGLLAEVDKEYTHQLHERRDKLLTETNGAAAFALAEDFLGQGDLDAAQTAYSRFVRTPGNKRGDVARAQRVLARILSARDDEPGAEAAWAKALSLDPGVAPPPESDPKAKLTFDRALLRMKGKPPLTLQHVPPARLKIGEAPRLRFEVSSDPLNLIDKLVLSYRAGGGAYSKLSAKPGVLHLPPEFNAGLAPGTRIEYHVAALDSDGAVLESLGSDSLPFALSVEAKPAKPVWKKWQFWVGIGAGALVVAGAAAAVGITQAPPDRIPIPITSGLSIR